MTDMKYYESPNFKETDNWEREYQYYCLVREGQICKDNKKYIYGIPTEKNKDCIKKINDITEIKKENKINTADIDVFNTCTCGVRVRFITDSPKIIIRVGIKRVWAFKKMNLYNSSGFDFYQLIAGKYVHLTVTGPRQGEAFFSDEICVVPNEPIEIYFPNYNSVTDFVIGILQGKKISETSKYKIADPVIFYGNSITQGASASRSGNAFANIVSRKLDCDILNYSFSGACKGEKKMAEIISAQKMSAMVIDYSRNAKTIEEFGSRYPIFYNVIRQAHPYVPIVLLGGFLIGQEYEEIIFQLYEKEARNGKNIFYISQNELFRNEDELYLSIDFTHYTDMGMYRVADSIVSLLRGRI